MTGCSKKNCLIRSCKYPLIVSGWNIFENFIEERLAAVTGELVGIFK